MADFNPDLMKQAQNELESMRNNQLPGISPHAIQQMLNLVRLRTEPAARLREISAALAGPKPDPDYGQDLDDLNWYLNNKLDSTPIREDFGSEYERGTQPEFEEAFGDAADLNSASPLIDWLITFQSPSASAKKHALAEWKRTASTPWLAVALVKASAHDPQTPALLEAAARVAPTSPAWPTITYHRIRLLIDSGHPADARRELETTLPRVQALGSDSALNLFTGLRMRTASTLEEALPDAPRKIIERSSQEQAALDECLDVIRDPKRKYDCKEDKSPVEFSGDAAAIFNNSLPLDTLAQAAQSKALPPSLSRSVAMMTWVRAILLKNDKVATQMLPVLPQKLQQQASSGVGFRPLMTILRNPGLRPFLDPGVQRSASYDFVESYADNWWCSDWRSPYVLDTALRAQSVAFLTPVMRATGEKETATLIALRSSDEYLGSQVLDYARAHPDDPDIPEALYLTLRMIRYGCYHGAPESDTARTDSSRVPSIAREVGALMRQRYPKDPWTRKAAPFVWPAKKDG